jgi:hypothetical protein
MEWGSAPRTVIRELANPTSSRKGSAKRRVTIQARTVSPSTLGAFIIFPNDIARCDSKPALWRRRVIFTKEGVHHNKRLQIPEEPARLGEARVPPLCLDETIENYGWITHLRTKNALARNIPTKKQQMPKAMSGPRAKPPAGDPIHKTNNNKIRTCYQNSESSSGISGPS